MNKETAIAKLESIGILPAEFEKQSAFARAIMRTNKYLDGVARKNPASMMQAIFEACSVGLSLNPVQAHAYLIPRGAEITVMPSYRGLETIAMNTGKIEGFKSHLIHDGDFFEVELGLTDKVIHKPAFGSKRGEIIGAYAYVFFKGNMPPICEIMDIEQIKAIRERSDAYKRQGERSPWGKDFGEMARKTVLKRLCKHLNLGERFDTIAAMDNRDYQASDGQLQYIERLIHSAEMDSVRLARLENEAYSGNLSANRASEIIATLKDNQKLTPEQQLKRIS